MSNRGGAAQQSEDNRSSQLRFGSLSNWQHLNIRPRREAMSRRWLPCTCSIQLLAFPAFWTVALYGRGRRNDRRPGQAETPDFWPPSAVRESPWPPIEDVPDCWREP